jgi:hypothetical protein
VHGRLDYRISGLPSVWYRTDKGARRTIEAGRALARNGETENSVKVYLTDGQVLRLLCVGGWCNLGTVRSAQPMEYAIMNTIYLTTRFAQAAFAVMVTTASVLVFQFALLAG